MFVLTYGFQTSSRQIPFEDIETELFSTREGAEKRILTIGREWYDESNISSSINPVEMFESTEKMAKTLVQLDFDGTPSFLFNISEVELDSNN